MSAKNTNKKTTQKITLDTLRLTGIAGACLAMLLTGCGGGSDIAASAPSAIALQAAPLSTATTMLAQDVPEIDAATAAIEALPTFHAAPGLLQEPDDTDASTPDASARRAPSLHAISADFAATPTARLTPQSMRQTIMRGAPRPTLNPDGTVAPMAASAVATYTPAQIRAAYGLPALPAAGAALTAAQVAALGAGQTIYIVDAMHDPNAIAELAAFNTKFGLPACATKIISATATLPLSSPSTTACEISVVYNTAAGGMTTAAPAYDSGWATEIALDVQWAHATAPLARIVLIEAADASINSLVGGVKLANAMGPGSVSMSFGANEGSWTPTYDAAFTAPNMTYLAATGDNGASVSWPSVSANVLAVGGTSLTYSGTGTRSETTWSGTGGGTSAYVATPSYQSTAVPGMGVRGHRTAADVAFNADPNTGQYVVTMAPGSTAGSWISAGGTSLSTPQWAGLVAIANAQRALAAKPALGAPHAVLYGQISTVPGTYASSFADITTGADGTCATCAAKAGYDQATGLGTPNVSALMSALGGATAAPVAPVVAPVSISGKVGTALSFTAASTSPNAVAYSMTGAPAGMAITSAGAVSWAAPVAGTYSVTIIATDTKTALKGQGVYTITIAAPAAPVVAPVAISGKVGVPLAFTAVATNANPVTFSMTGAPAGMSITSAGAASWAAPVAGTYNVVIVAKDAKTGLSGQGAYTVAIAAPLPPVVSVPAVAGKPGVALSFAATTVSPNPVSYALTGAPAGMTISSAGVVSWPVPVLGTYNVTVVAKDTKTGLTGQAVAAVKIAVAGPTFTTTSLSGAAGKTMTGVISIADSGAITWMQVSISGAPLGMSFTMSGLNITATWPNAVAGTYNLKLTALDSLGLSTAATIPVVIK